MRISAPWPPTAGNCSGAKIKSISLSERPLTSASAPLVRTNRRFSVFASPGGTQTSRGVGISSSSVPSMSSKMAVSLKCGTSERGTGTVSGAPSSSPAISSSNGISSQILSHLILLHKG